MDEPEQQLWQRYTDAPADQRDALRNQLVEIYLPLAAGIAKRKHKSLPDCVEYDDLFAAAYIGLINAIPRFDPDRKLQPRTFLVPRIRGAVLDYLRSVDDLSRSRRIRQVRVDQWTQTHLDHRPTDDEIYEHFGFLVGSPRTISINTPINDRYDHDQTVSDSLANRTAPVERASLGELSDLLHGCTKKERLLLLMYYIDGVKMSDIGRSIGISESRVSQMHSHLMKRLRRRAIATSAA